ncbi:MAG: redox-sensing transcriptional repressor Rex [Candidatus Eisenbacteria bacterium]|nr:redox-sensing transcriptional repressor Rex [Candidatus Eisenbacteria bacterium]
MPRISESTVRRLSHYYRALAEVEAEGGDVISSQRLAEREGTTPAQVRKDLSHFGSFGRRGLGYNVAHLRREIRRILGLDRRWRVAVVGAGHIGAALLGYRGFSAQGFDVVAVFDNDPQRIGQVLGAVQVRDVAELRAAAAAEAFDIGVVATPPPTAQAVADLLVSVGVSAILNFAPRKLFIPARVALRNVDLTMALENLSFALTPARGSRRRRAQD